MEVPLTPFSFFLHTKVDCGTDWEYQGSCQTKWEHVTSSVAYRLLSCLSVSYANVKKCSNEGRALMQLDFQQFLMKLEKLTDIRPIPDKEFVETYIKAYYLTENDMERWIKEHRVRTHLRLLTLDRRAEEGRMC